MRIYKRAMDILAKIEKLVLVVVSIIVTVITFANVVARAAQGSFAWSEELVINLFVLMIMLGCALCAREGTLISLSLVFDRLNRTAKKVFVLIITIVNSAFWIVLMKTGMEKVLTQMANGSETFSLRWPEWWFTIFLPIGAVFLLIHTIEFFVDVMTNQAECVKLDKGGDN